MKNYCTNEGVDCEACSLSSYGRDCHNIPIRSKAEFKATREQIGMSQQLLADLVQVDVRSVRRWEHPDNEWYAPQDAWDILEFWLERQNEEIDFALEKVDETKEKTGNAPGCVHLHYYSNAAHFAVSQPDDDPRMWQMANATVRQIAIELGNMGITSQFSY